GQGHHDWPLLLDDLAAARLALVVQIVRFVLVLVGAGSVLQRVEGDLRVLEEVLRRRVWRQMDAQSLQARDRSRIPRRNGAPFGRLGRFGRSRWRLAALALFVI